MPKFRRAASAKERALRRNITILLASAKARAAARDLPCSITRQDIVIPELCPVLGVPLQRGTLTEHDFAPSLDRIIPSLGYVPGNIQVISVRANRIKTDATHEELRRVYEYVKSQT